MHREGKKSSRSVRLHPGRFRQPRDASRSVSEISDRVKAPKDISSDTVVYSNQINLVKLILDAICTAEVVCVQLHRQGWLVPLLHSGHHSFLRLGAFGLRTGD